jgi:hypothetical protein
MNECDKIAKISEKNFFLYIVWCVFLLTGLSKCVKSCDGKIVTVCYNHLDGVNEKCTGEIQRGRARFLQEAIIFEKLRSIVSDRVSKVTELRAAISRYKMERVWQQTRNYKIHFH